MPTHRLPRIGITLGDPAGIGPELALRVLADRGLRRVVTPVLYGHAALLRRVSVATGIPWPDGLDAVGLQEAGAAADVAGIEPGRADAAGGRLALGWIRAAVSDAMAGRLEAVVTGPVSKKALSLAGCRHPGHTELLAELTGSPEVRMLFYSPDLVVGLVTIHLPLAAVPTALTLDRILTTIRMTAAARQTAAQPRPSVGVLALNPHAGEEGLIGDEESRIIVPAIAAARREGLDVHGPLVPDTTFVPAHRGRFAAYVAMYHDQGLIPFKMLAFDTGVNVTLGLPIVRTSPDHGTAYDLAWRGMASPASLAAAIECAAQLAAVRGG